MALHGVAFALVLVGGVTFVSRHAPTATAATAQGILSATVFSIAMIVGPGIGSWVADQVGVPALFTLAWTTSTVAIPVIWLAVRSPEPERAVPASEISR
jgi:MFS family permease